MDKSTDYFNSFMKHATIITKGGAKGFNSFFKFLSPLLDSINIYFKLNTVSRLVLLTETGSSKAIKGVTPNIFIRIIRKIREWNYVDDTTKSTTTSNTSTRTTREKMTTRDKEQSNTTKQSDSKMAQVVTMILGTVISLVILWLVLYYLFYYYFWYMIFFIALIVPMFNFVNNFKKRDKIRPDLFQIYKLLYKNMEEEVLFEYLEKYMIDMHSLESDLKIEIDTKHLNVFYDNDLCEVLEFKVSKKGLDKKESDEEFYKIKKSKDRIMRNYSLLPFFTTNIAKYVNNDTIQIVLDYSLANFSNDYDNVPDFETYLFDNVLFQSFPDLVELNERNKWLKLGYTKDEVTIIRYLSDEETKKLLGLSIDNSFANGISKTKKFLKIKLEFSGKTNKNNIKEKSTIIGSKLGITPLIIQGEKDNYCYMLFVMNNKFKGKTLKYKDIIEMASKRQLNLGATMTEDLIIDMPVNTTNKSFLFGASAGSGKSSLLNLILSFYFELKDEFGDYLVEEAAFLSVKGGEDAVPPFGKTNMKIAIDVEDQFQTLDRIDKYMTERGKIFEDAKVKDMTVYNEKLAKGELKTNKYTPKKMGFFVLVVDEKQNGDADMNSEKVDKKSMKDVFNEKLEKISRTHRSRGLILIVSTQEFGTKSVGDIIKSLLTKILGVADKYVWSSIDSSETMYKHISANNKSNIGQFYFKTTSLPLVKSIDNYITLSDLDYVEISSHYIDESEVAKNITRKFNTINTLDSIAMTSSDIEETEDFINEQTEQPKQIDFGDLDI